MNKGELTTKRLMEQSGYINIFMKNVDIVKESDIILHVVNLHEIENILDQMKENINLLKIKNRHLLQLELLDAKNKLVTLIPKQNRQRRGLINGIGSVSKWLFGTMDDEDRQNIQKHLFSIDQIEANNDQQILINDYLNETISHLKMIVKNDRKIIEKELNSVNKFLETENDKHIYLEQLSNIQLIKNRIEHLQDNVISTKYGLAHPSILTSSEIAKYAIDYNKLKYIQIGTTFVNNSCLIFGIKIPKTFITVKLKYIVPLPNDHSEEIDSIIEQTIDFENKTYKFEENKHLKNLKLSNHCLIKNTCQLIKNSDLEIIQLDIDTFIIKNAVNISINQNCNLEKIMLNGNYIVNFNNCSVRIKDYYFSNIIENIEEKHIIENTHIEKNFSHKITFEEIKTLNINNLRNIKALQYHKNLSYGLNLLLTIIIIIIVIFVIVKQRYIKIILNKRIQENSNLKEGEVKYIKTNNNTYISNDPIDEFIANIINNK